MSRLIAPPVRPVKSQLLKLSQFVNVEPTNMGNAAAEIKLQLSNTCRPSVSSKIKQDTVGAENVNPEHLSLVIVPVVWIVPVKVLC